MKLNIEGIIKLAKQAAEGIEEAANAARDVADAPWAGPYSIEETAGAAAEAAELAAHDSSTVVGELRKLAQGLATSGTARRGAPELAAALRRAGNWKLAAFVLAAILIAIGGYFGVKWLRERLQAKDEEELQFTKAEADELQTAIDKAIADGEESLASIAETAKEIVEIAAEPLDNWADEAEAAAERAEAAAAKGDIETAEAARREAAENAEWVADIAEAYSGESARKEERARYARIVERARAAAKRARKALSSAE